MSSTGRLGGSSAPQGKDILDFAAGWTAALCEIQHQAEHLEGRGAIGGAVTLFDAIRIARAGGLRCEHRAQR